jgi:hypothetical protein
LIETPQGQWFLIDGGHSFCCQTPGPSGPDKRFLLAKLSAFVLLAHVTSLAICAYLVTDLYPFLIVDGYPSETILCFNDRGEQVAGILAHTTSQFQRPYPTSRLIRGIIGLPQGEFGKRGETYDELNLDAVVLCST